MLDRMHYSARTPFVEKAFNGKYPVRVPSYMLESTYCAAGLFDRYETEHLESMAEHLKLSDVLFDIGAETGWLSALYGRHFVAPSNLCLFEPSDVQWPTIKAIWEANGLATPRATYLGFVADKDHTAVRCPFDQTQLDGWPKIAHSPFLNEANQFRKVIERPDIPSITIDTFVRETGIIPTAITLDIEGAEFLAMRGAYDTLKAYHPKIWMSIHMHPADDFVGEDWAALRNHTVGPLLYDYHHTRGDILAYMEDFGYEATYLGYSCEENWFFERK